MSFGLKLNIRFFYFLNILFMPLSWVILAGVGDSAFKIFHLFLIPLLIAFVFKKYRETFILFISKQRVFISMFLILMILNFISTGFNSTVSPNAYVYIYKNLFYFFIYLLYGAGIMLFFDLETHPRIITISNISSIILFLGIAVFTFKGDFISDLSGFFLKGDLDGVKRDVYKSLFNSGSNADEDLQANLLNQLTGTFIIIYFTSLYALNNLNSKIYKFINIVAMAISVALIIANLSRSNIIAWIFGYMIFWGCEIIINRNYKKALVFAGGAMIFILFIVIFWTQLSTKLDATSEMFQERFGSQISDNERWALNAEAISDFTKNFFNFFIGEGSGARLSDGHAVHNFVLGSAYQAGVFGLLISCVVYLSMPFWLWKSLPVLSKFKYGFTLPALIAVPLIRMMESGNAGTLTMQEWFCLAMFLGYYYKKQIELNNNERPAYPVQNNLTTSGKLIFSTS